MTDLKKVYVWYDPEGDYLEVGLGESKEGDTRDTADDRVLVKVDDDGNIIGFSILAVSKMQKERATPFEVDLTSRRPPRNIRPKQRQSG